MADASVRPTKAEDSGEIARIQATVWAAVHHDTLPAELLAEVGSGEAAEQWRLAATAPADPRQRVLTALSDEQVVGFVAVAPAEDPDLDPAHDGELVALCVDPSARGAGHGSRRVNAAAATATEQGMNSLHVWVSPAEADLRVFLAGAGWRPDGARRDLDLRGDGDVVLAQTRLHVSLLES